MKKSCGLQNYLVHLLNQCLLNLVIGHALQDGGYYLNDLTRCHEMVRRGEQLRIQGKTLSIFKQNTTRFLIT